MKGEKERGVKGERGRSKGEKGEEREGVSLMPEWLEE